MSCSTAWMMATDPRAGRALTEARRGLRLAAALIVVCCVGGAGCRTTAAPDPVGAAPVAEAIDLLARPLPGDLAALYHLRVPSSGGLRLSVLEAGGDGRMTVSEPFGAAVSITSWSSAGPSRFFDLRRGCRLDAVDVSATLGVAAMPMPQAIRLLGGRLPAVGDDRVLARSGTAVEVTGTDWRVLVTVAPAPWRVTEVEELAADGRRGWRIRLSDHTASVPGKLRIEGSERGWAELELIRLEWDGDRDLPSEPELPPCAGLEDEAS